ncbi:MAG: GTP-binding protein TypA [Anaerolineales bacterium]|nr:GTP-binding protein TypA [Anaerolineales bacterium]
MYFRGTFAAVVGVRRWAILALRDDELLEITPKSLRIRKRILDARIRGREEKRAKEALGA